VVGCFHAPWWEGQESGLESYDRPSGSGKSAYISSLPKIQPLDFGRRGATRSGWSLEKAVQNLTVRFWRSSWSDRILGHPRIAHSFPCEATRSGQVLLEGLGERAIALPEEKALLRGD
jgi:hypothetical protein